MRSRAQNWMHVLSCLDHVLMAVIMASLCWSKQWSNMFELLLLLLLISWWHFLHSYFGVYESHRLEGFRRVAANILTATTVGVLSVAPVLLVASSTGVLVLVAKFALVWLVVATGIRVIAYTALRSIRRRGHDQRHVLMIGSWKVAQELGARFSLYPEWGLQLDVVGTGPAEKRTFVRFPTGEPITSSLEDVLKTEVVDEILISCAPEAIASEQAAIEMCRTLGRQCRLRLDSEHVPAPQSVESVDGQLTWTVTAPEKHRALGLKRALDVVAAAVFLVLVSPLLLLTSLLVKLSSPGPIFFGQLRVGLNGRRFKIYKFRTMVEGAEAMLQSVASRNLTGGPTFKDHRDLRVTPLGRLLRRCSIDELPQLWNVLRGDMSLVGPRPLPVHESTAIGGVFQKRFAMRPGLTCYWQVMGRSDIPFQKWMELDIQYVDNWSLSTDALLLLRTIPAVLSGKGAY